MDYRSHKKMARSYYVTLFVLIFAIISCFFFFIMHGLLSVLPYSSRSLGLRDILHLIRPRSFACSFLAHAEVCELAGRFRLRAVPLLL